MNYKHLYYILIIALLSFVLCSCSKNQTKKEKEEESAQKKIYYEIEQNGVSEQEQDSCTFFIMKPDFGVFTETENETIKNIDGVTETEYYGGAARTKYYYQLNKDYTLTDDDGYVFFHMTDRQKEEHFVRSARNLMQEDLQAGRLPEAENEIVLYTSDKSMLGKTIEMYFLCNDLCDSSLRKYFETGGEASYIEKEMTITGIFREKTEQIYFSEQFCDMLGKTMTECALKFTTVLMYEAEENEDTAVQDKIGPNGSIRLDGMRYEDLEWNGKYEYVITPETNTAHNRIAYIDETLGKCRVALSKNYIENMEWMNRKLKENNSFSYKIYDFLELSYHMPKDRIYPGLDKMKNDWAEDEFSIIGYGRCEDVEWSFIEEKVKMHSILLGIRDTLSKSGMYTIAVSRELEAIYIMSIQ